MAKRTEFQLIEWLAIIKSIAKSNKVLPRYMFHNLSHADDDDFETCKRTNKCLSKYQENNTSEIYFLLLLDKDLHFLKFDHLIMHLMAFEWNLYIPKITFFMYVTPVFIKSQLDDEDLYSFEFNLNIMQWRVGLLIGLTIIIHAVIWIHETKK